VQADNRYESAMMQELYGKVKSGNIDSNIYVKAQERYKSMAGKLIIRGLTERFDYSVLDLQDAITDVKRRHNFTPDCIIVDYGDLLAGRDKKGYKSETEKQKAAFRDLKVLASRGYAIWTASQAQRPKEGAEVKEELLRARNIADCYEKVRVADFLGSLNQTLEERQEKVMRIYAELYRDNAADEAQAVHADFSKMTIEEVVGIGTPTPQPTATSAFGYGNLQEPVQSDYSDVVPF